VTSQELARRLHLVVITDRRAAAPRSVLEVVAAGLGAGAPAVQLRDKDADARSLHEAGEALLALTRPAGALLFVNDRVDVALALGADGVHVGPDDLPVAALRRAVPPHFLIGASTDDPEVAADLARDGASYIGCGTVYRTSTKADAGAVIGLEGLDRVARAVPVPVVGIGGITPERSAEVARTAAAGVAVVSAVMGAADVDASVRALLAPWR
jgi:thiamine-phosphate diphosphorylase